MVVPQPDILQAHRWRTSFSEADGPRPSLLVATSSLGALFFSPCRFLLPWPRLGLSSAETFSPPSRFCRSTSWGVEELSLSEHVIAQFLPVYWLGVCSCVCVCLLILVINTSGSHFALSENGKCECTTFLKKGFVRNEVLFVTTCVNPGPVSVLCCVCLVISRLFFAQVDLFASSQSLSSSLICFSRLFFAQIRI